MPITGQESKQEGPRQQELLMGKISILCHIKWRRNESQSLCNISENSRSVSKERLKIWRRKKPPLRIRGEPFLLSPAAPRPPHPAAAQLQETIYLKTPSPSPKQSQGLGRTTGCVGLQGIGRSCFTKCTEIAFTFLWCFTEALRVGDLKKKNR